MKWEESRLLLGLQTWAMNINQFSSQKTFNMIQKSETLWMIRIQDFIAQLRPEGDFTDWLFIVQFTFFRAVVIKQVVKIYLQSLSSQRSPNNSNCVSLM